MTANHFDYRPFANGRGNSLKLAFGTREALWVRESPMAHTIGRLTALKINRLSRPGTHADGGGLYLQVTGAAAKSWIFRYSRSGRSARAFAQTAPVALLERSY